ncbi:amidohydrolase family protein [Lentzea sp. DG1S-22]|uniref:amidohydrolase family protein n=1 Tax=Lentzea sp. DG1S-22 TaxID=3108822 RepID=UPI002E7986D6|nr:amidohydrolase family protein [Lentzea sp. DG1S-22]WVH83096.1 amidohydrolase family protein [Lentzea sp. DG1S-22]
MYSDDLVRPWWDALQVQDPLFDVHTHLGTNDPSGFSATAAQLREALAGVDARAAVFPLTEPDGYREANDAVLAEARSDEVLVAFCRVTPDDAGEARRCVEAGAAGIKLHPASDEFALGDDRLEEVFGLAHELRLPVLLHAGPEIDPYGVTLPDVLDRFPGARFVLAHAGLTDLAWLAGNPKPNLFFDTSWWSATDVVTVLGTIPPGQVLLGSDVPYSTPTWGAHATARCAQYAGLAPDQVASVMGGQARRLVDRADPADLGPAPGRVPPLDPLLERLFVYLCAGVEATKRGESPGQTLDLARHCCHVPPGHPHKAVFESVWELLDRYEKHAPQMETGNEYAAGWDLIATAAVVARTPGTPLPLT